MNNETKWNIQRSLFTTTKPTDKVHLCAIAINPRAAINYGHEFHKDHVEGSNITLYSVAPKSDFPEFNLTANDLASMDFLDRFVQLPTKVKMVSRPHDLLLLETVKDSFNYFPTIQNIERVAYFTKDYTLIGVDPETRKFSYDKGMIKQEYGSWIVGSSLALPGHSGAAVCDFQGNLIGMALGRREFKIPLQQESLKGIFDMLHAAYHISDSIILDTRTIYNAVVPQWPDLKFHGEQRTS